MARYLHFEFRADSFSGDTDTVTVEAVWISKSGDVTSLGTFVSDPAVPAGDAPWKIVNTDVSATIPKSASGRVQLKRVSGEDNAHFRNVWIEQQTSFLGGNVVFGQPTLPDYYEYVVPSSFTELSVEAWGAKGADGPGRGGYGGHILSSVSVVPNETLRIYCGSQGVNDSPGRNGGGYGGGLSGGGTAGGGATDIRRAPYGLSDRLVVAGGGGGGGDFGHGGDGGGPVGEDGQGGGYGGTLSGHGGAQTFGGANGAGTTTGGPNSGAGAFGYGGNAQLTNPGGYGQGCGGGGAGWYGGGCGGPDHWNEGASGGGGSSYTVGSYLINERGVQNGDGRLVIHEIDPDYGEYPKTFPYVADVEDGVLAGTTILNDGGSAGQEYYAESGEPIDPSDFNYSVSWRTKAAGTYAKNYDNWIDTGALWLIDGTGAVMSGYSTHPPFGTPLFNMLGRNWYPEIRPDGFVGAPHHNIDMGVTTAGSRGMSLIGPIWGWNSWSDYFFAINGGHSSPASGVYRVQGGVPTFLGSLPGNSLGGAIHVRHDFLTGALDVWTHEFMFGGETHYTGNHPHSVGAGYAGWMADEQNTGFFGDTTWCTDWSNIFEPGHIAHQRQFSMETLTVVEQDPPTWYFGQQITPPLRQRNRDDGLATDARQLKGYGSSQQSSLRRGGRVYY